MTDLHLPFWTDLFASKSGADFLFEMWVIRKSGNPFLFLPDSPALAANALSLYPAQTSRAKLARASLRTAFRFHLPVPLEIAAFKLNSKEPFSQFLAGLVDTPIGSFPRIAVLAGNPGSTARRYILLVFDDQNQPALVVKAGLGEAARRLIRHEASFLHSAPAGTPGLPLLRASFDAGDASAFALDFVAGDSPKPEAWPMASKLLSAWLNREKMIQLAGTKSWSSLEYACSTNAIFKKLALPLSKASFHPTIFHGDFAPWNIKVLPREQTWRALDWERGDLSGIPAWDWFHFVIQSGVLANKLNPEQLLQTIDNLFASSDFKNYAGLANILGHERFLLMAYLLHLIQVIRPSEGLQTNQSLLELLARRWLP